MEHNDWLVVNPTSSMAEFLFKIFNQLTGGVAPIPHKEQMDSLGSWPVRELIDVGNGSGETSLVAIPLQIGE